MSEQGHAAPPVGNRPATPAAPAAWRRWGVAASIGACLAAGSFALVLLVLGRGETTLLVTDWADRFNHAVADAAAPPAAAPHPAADAAAGPAANPAAAQPGGAQPRDGKPSFDIVRVTPSGNSVIAGRAAPNADVVISDNGAGIGHVQADARGDWVFLPPAPLAPGGSELTLASRAPDGTVTPGDSPVIVLVAPVAASSPDATAPTGLPPPALPPPALPPPALPPVVLLTPPDAPPRLLQSPAEASLPGGANGGPAARGQVQLGLDVVDYDERGDIRFAGRAPAGADIRLYIDRQAAGDARSDGLGRWALTPERTVDPGGHQLRVDQLSPAGQVAARVEVPFQRVELPPEATDPAPGQERVVVQPRQTLWALARHAYGHGVRYTVIYQANREQIRNPDLIYPGQVFTVPSPGDGGAALAASPAPQAAAATGKPMPVSSSSVR